MKSNSFDTPDEQRLAATAELLQALAHPVRLRIVCGLLDGSCCVGPMVDCLELPQAFVSRHLSVLRSAGVVTSEVEGRKRVYRVAHPLVPELVRLLLSNPQQPPRFFPGDAS
jgi:ArsR family transcriptional regulator